MLICKEPELMTPAEHEAKIEFIFAQLCPYCKHRWGEHAIKGCQNEDCRGKPEGCDYNGIVAIRNMMNSSTFQFDPEFKPAPLFKHPPIEVQTKLW